MQDLPDMLRIDPLDYVANMGTPIGLYLRSEVLGEVAEGDESLRRKLYREIVEGQAPDGSWGQSFVHTANRLWDLALMGFRSKDSHARKGLVWLLAQQTLQYHGQPGFFNSTNKNDPRIMRDTYYGEFGPGCSNFYQTTYAVHLLNTLGYGEGQAERSIRSYLEFWGPEWCGAWCTINVLRVLLEHPLSSGSENVESGLKYLAKRQTRTGAWKGFPFYHTFHALSRGHHDLVEHMLDWALPSVIRRQNRNGSWGRREPETETYLILDGLRNRETGQ